MSGDLAIRAEWVSKRFRIQHGAKVKYKTLRDIVAGSLFAPFRRFTGKQDHSLPVGNKNGRAGSAQYLWALRNIDLEVKKGEIVGIIGHNGAGKSTLLKVFTRISEPTTGVIDIYGRVGSLLEVGTGFHKELTGRENVYLNGAILGMKKAEIDRKFDEIVAFAEVEEFIDTPTKFYSSGMQVRLAFAVAAHLEPEILIIDEVLAVGDASFQKKCLDKMEDVGREGRTILFVSHHMPSVLRLCERVVLLRKGELIRSGTPEDIVSEYLTQNLGIDASREWEDIQTAPGNDIVRLRAIRVKNEDNQIKYNFDVREPVGVEMEYEVLKPGYALYPHFSLHNEENLWLFTSIDTDPTWRGVLRPVGRYTSTAWIPGNLLTEGTRIVGPAIRTEVPRIVHFHVRDAVAFQVTESPDGDTARMDYPGRFPGVIRPLLKWQTEVVAEKLTFYGK